MKAAVDTTFILGRGAVKDTYNLLADGIVQVVRALAALDGTPPEEWALRLGLESYFGSSVKGEAEINWDKEKERRTLLQKIVAEPAGYWNWPARPGRDFQQTAPSARVLEKRRSCWGNCCCRTWNLGRMVPS